MLNFVLLFSLWLCFFNLSCSCALLSIQKIAVNKIHNSSASKELRFHWKVKDFGNGKRVLRTNSLVVKWMFHS